jgi:hypothetical protein
MGAKDRKYGLIQLATQCHAMDMALVKRHRESNKLIRSYLLHEQRVAIITRVEQVSLYYVNDAVTYKNETMVLGKQVINIRFALGV